MATSSQNGVVANMFMNEYQLPPLRVLNVASTTTCSAAARSLETYACVCVPTVYYIHSGKYLRSAAKNVKQQERKKGL